MGKSKFYAVKKGKKVGIFETYQECLDSVKGYSGAEYKSFSSFDEAQAYLQGIDLNDDILATNQKAGFCTIFCDGSYKNEDGVENYSGAYILITANGNDSSQNFIGRKAEYLQYQNVAGELIAAIQGIDNAISLEQDKIRLYYDYEGIEKWATGKWSANNDLSKFYVNKINDFYKIVDIEFIKVKGHSNNSLNEQVDKLAKEALLGNKVHKKSGTNFIYVSNVSVEQYDLIVELLKEVETFKITSKNISKEKKQSIVLDLKGAKANITYFVSTRSILIQGDSKKCVFQLILTYINELFEDVKIEKLLTQSYEKKIDMSVVDDVEKVFPNLPKDYPCGIIKLLKQALINLKNHFEAEDYSMYAFPALRALEGHIKYLLSKNGYQMFSTNLECFEKIGINFRFREKDNPNFKEIIKWNKIETCYTFFYYNRHPYFHYGTPLGASDDTKIMENFDECEVIIQNIFAIIQESL